MKTIILLSLSLSLLTLLIYFLSSGRQALFVACKSIRKNIFLSFQTGEEFYSYILDVETYQARLTTTSLNNIPAYKFFSRLLEMLLTQKNLYGGGRRDIIRSLKEAVLKDIRFEKKLLTSINSAFSQFLIVSAVTWFFIFASIAALKISLSPLILVLILLLQSLGLISYYFLSRKLKHSAFFNFELYFKTLYTFKVLASTQLSIKETTSQSGILALFTLKDKRLDSLNSRLKLLVVRWSESGVPLTEELEVLVGDLHFALESAHDAFLSRITLLKFLSLALFYLSAYFVFLLYLVFTFLY